LGAELLKGPWTAESTVLDILLRRRMLQLAGWGFGSQQVEVSGTDALSTALRPLFYLKIVVSVCKFEVVHWIGVRPLFGLKLKFER
jgi:hypothetical protein